VSITFELSAAFVIAQDVPMTAEDLGYGLRHGFLKPADVVALALHEVERQGDDEFLIALASLLGDETGRVPEVLNLLDDPERVHDPRESARKWLYLQLKAAYDERDNLRDPLSAVEQIYADFEYPSTVAPFVRYMPLSPGEEPGVGSIMIKWKDYLAREEVALRRPSAGPPATPDAGNRL
jgi:hypothetical protein